MDQLQKRFFYMIVRYGVTNQTFALLDRHLVIIHSFNIRVVVAPEVARQQYILSISGQHIHTFAHSFTLRGKLEQLVYLRACYGVGGDQEPHTDISNLSSALTNTKKKISRRLNNGLITEEFPTFCSKAAADPHRKQLKLLFQMIIHQLDNWTILTPC